MGSCYIHGLLLETRDAFYGDVNPDNFFEFRANEFRKIYYALGLYYEFSHSSFQSFEDYIVAKGFYDIDAADEIIDWRVVRKGVQFARDYIMNANSSSSGIFCSGVMLKKLAYKRKGRRITIPRKADIIIEAILEYICNNIADVTIQQCFIRILTNDVLRVSGKTFCSELTNIQCRNALLTFQIKMLQSKESSSSRRLLDNLCNVNAYKYILQG